MHLARQALPVVGALVLAALAGALLTGNAQRAAPEPPEDAIDHVTLYQNGLAAVERTFAFASEGEPVALAFTVPSTTRLESLRLAGAEVELQELRTTLPAEGPLEPGDRVVVHVTDGRSFAGTFAGDEQGRLTLATDAGIVVIEPDDVVAIEIGAAQPADEAPGRAQVSALVRAPPGEHVLTLSYLAQGSGWTPSYQLDVETGELRFYAILTALEAWRDVRLDLVSGEPNLAFGPAPVPLAGADFARDEAAAEADVVGPEAPLGALHRFPVEGLVSLERGERARLLVEQGDVPVETRYEVVAHTGGFGLGGEDQAVPVRERAELENTLDATLPQGRLLAYRGGTWIGEDVLSTTPPGDTANVTLSAAQDVEARLVLQQANATAGRDTLTYALHVDSHEETPVELRAVMTYPVPRANLLATAPEPAEVFGDRVVWTSTLAPGESERFLLRYAVERDPNVPPPMPVREEGARGTGSPMMPRGP